MKKLIALLLALVMVLGLSACGGESSTPGSAQDSGNNKKPYTFIEQVLVDNDLCSITLTEIIGYKDPDSPFSQYEIMGRFENKTSDTQLSISITDLVIDGVALIDSTYFGFWLYSGKTEETAVNIRANMLRECGHTDFTHIQFTLCVSDGNKDVVNETVHVYPYGEENVKNYVYQAAEDDLVILDNEVAYAVITRNSTVGNQLVVVNKTDKALQFCFEDIALDGYEVDPDLAFPLEPNGACMTEFQWPNDENAPFSFEDITMQIIATDLAGEELVNEAVSLHWDR